MNSSIRISEKIVAEMIAQARRDAGVECCGLLAGRDGGIARIFPAANAAGNPATSYEIAPQEIFEAMRAMRAEGIEMLGIYHSHPNGKNEPSARDIEQAYYSEAAYFIISPRDDSQRAVRAFAIRDGRAVELEIHIAP